MAMLASLDHAGCGPGRRSWECRSHVSLREWHEAEWGRQRY